MYNFIVILILIVCVLLSCVVLLQNSKGGGLASGFSAPGQIMGARKATDFFEKATWVLATALVVLCLIAAIIVKGGQSNGTVSSENKIEVNQGMTLPAQALPEATATPAPAEQE